MRLAQLFAQKQGEHPIENWTDAAEAHRRASLEWLVT
jgi:hypothetical protein